MLLLRATTNMGFYERALEERGIPTHVVGGRGYWSQQQVADLRHWLAALANPLDELALYRVLASPLGGLSLDALALIGRARDGERARPVVDCSRTRPRAAATAPGCRSAPDRRRDGSSAFVARFARRAPRGAAACRSRR